MHFYWQHCFFLLGFLGFLEASVLGRKEACAFYWQHRLVLLGFMGFLEASGLRPEETTTRVL